MKERCSWCLETGVPFEKKAHAIPKSLVGQNYKPNACDNCNEFGLERPSFQALFLFMLYN